MTLGFLVPFPTGTCSNNHHQVIILAEKLSRQQHSEDTVHRKVINKNLLEKAINKCINWYLFNYIPKPNVKRPEPKPMKKKLCSKALV